MWCGRDGAGIESTVWMLFIISLKLRGGGRTVSGVVSLSYGWNARAERAARHDLQPIRSCLKDNCYIVSV